MVFGIEIWEYLLLAGLTVGFLLVGGDPRKEPKRFKRFLRFLVRDLSRKK